jgi:hypothetical protein
LVKAETVGQHKVEYAVAAAGDKAQAQAAYARDVQEALQLYLLPTSLLYAGVN